MSITFAEFTHADIPVILSMMQQFNAIDNYPFNEAERTENLNALLNHPDYGKLWLIRKDDAIAGYTFLGFGFSFEFKGRDAFVDELFILPQFQSQGIGKLAIDFVTEEARNAGVKALHLEAEHHNERGLRLYRGKGFKDHKRFLLTKYL
ncbi:MAG TPA: GNAT family N-acetyltransferase [Chryseosolibacter sp.]